MTKATWKTELETYVEELRVSGKSKQYVGDVNRYMTHLGKHSGVRSFIDLTRAQVISWMKELKERGVTGKPRPGGKIGLKDITLRATVGKLKTFLRHLNEGVFPAAVQNLPRLSVSNGSKVKSPEELLTPAEGEAIAVRLQQPYKAAFIVLEATGARPTEILSLKPSDISEPKVDEVGVRRDITIRDSKTGKPRTVWVYGRAKEALDDALRLAESKAYVIFNSKGGPTNYSVYGRKLGRAAEEAGIKKTVYPYLTRHGFITTMLRKGVKDKSIMAMTGHSTRSMLDHYGHLTQEETLNEIAPFLSGAGEMTATATLNIEAEIERRIEARMAEERARWDAENEETINRYIDKRVEEFQRRVRTGGMVSEDEDPAPTEDEDPYADLDEVGDE